MPKWIPDGSSQKLRLQEAASRAVEENEKRTVFAKEDLNRVERASVKKEELEAEAVGKIQASTRARAASAECYKATVADVRAAKAESKAEYAAEVTRRYKAKSQSPPLDTFGGLGQAADKVVNHLWQIVGRRPYVAIAVVGCMYLQTAQ